MARRVRRAKSLAEWTRASLPVLNAPPKEASIQAGILGLLVIHPKVAWAVRMNTGAMMIEATERTKRRYIRFAFTGCSDIIGQMKDGRFLAIECKRPGSRTDADRFEAQAQFLATVKANGGVAGMCYSITDAEELLAGA